MATTFLSTANTSLAYALSSSASSSTSLTTSTSICPPKRNSKKALTLCKSVINESPSPSPILTKRSLSICLTTTFLFSVAGTGYPDNKANAAILEADDDVELLERVKQDRKKRLERQGILKSSNKETAYLQDIVYKLSKVGQAIDNNDLTTASSVLGTSTDTDWVQKAKTALIKLSDGPEEKTEVDTFNSSLASLISSVIRKDVESSKIAFVSSATAFEKWTALTGLVSQLKGL